MTRKTGGLKGLGPWKVKVAVVMGMVESWALKRPRGHGQTCGKQQGTNNRNVP